MIDKDKLKNYKKSLEDLQKLVDDLNKKKADFEKDNASLIEDIKKMNENIEIDKNILKAEALMEYNETKNKKLSGGLGIRNTKTMSYDANKALEWCMEKKLCLTLDKKAFEKVADITPNLEWVTKGNIDSVTFPSEIKIDEEV